MNESSALLIILFIQLRFAGPLSLGSKRPLSRSPTSLSDDGQRPSNYDIESLARSSTSSSSEKASSYSQQNLLTPPSPPLITPSGPPIWPPQPSTSQMFPPPVPPPPTAQQSLFAFTPFAQLSQASHPIHHPQPLHSTPIFPRVSTTTYTVAIALTLTL